MVATRIGILEGPVVSALGHSLPMHSAPVPINVRFTPKSGHSSVDHQCPLSAKSGHSTKPHEDVYLEMSRSGPLLRARWTTR